MTNDPTRHAPDPRDEVRECGGCLDCTQASFLAESIMSPRICSGRGYVVGRECSLIGGEGFFQPARSQDVIEVWQWDEPQDGEELWVRRCRGRSGDYLVGGYPTADEALLVARCEYWGVVIAPTAAYGGALWNAWSNEGALLAGEELDPNAALCAVIDAREPTDG